MHMCACVGVWMWNRVGWGCGMMFGAGVLCVVFVHIYEERKENLCLSSVRFHLCFSPCCFAAAVTHSLMQDGMGVRDEDDILNLRLSPTFDL
mmetsp:Transcript_24518/g.62090  ORF Transcript_24518/g.62090 Transcript_24518/m.62090 type:complete len:92 (-) Transcript_24518:154-429(-)